MRIKNNTMVFLKTRQSSPGPVSHARSQCHPVDQARTKGLHSLCHVMRCLVASGQSRQSSRSRSKGPIRQSKGYYSKLVTRGDSATLNSLTVRVLYEYNIHYPADGFLENSCIYKPRGARSCTRNRPPDPHAVIVTNAFTCEPQVLPSHSTKLLNARFEVNGSYLKYF